MLDRSFIGFETKPRAVEVETSQLRFFADATGMVGCKQCPSGRYANGSHTIRRSSNETHTTDVQSAINQAQGKLPIDLPAPPTFLFCLVSLAPDAENIIARLGVDMGRVLHGEQSFTYGEPIYAGDIITLRTRISDIYDKRGGALDFIVEDTEATNQKGDNVGVTRTVIVVRNG